jgi:Domain of unknown function (DUF4082)/Bacterial Ig-like domain/Bacterial Ig domain
MTLHISCRWPVWKLALALVLFVALGLSVSEDASTAPCDSPIANPIACENTKQGAPTSEWDISGAGDPTIQGFATDISVDQGQTVSFKVQTDAADYRIDIYRLGYYNGLGARKIATVQPSASLPQAQPDCLTDDSVGLIDCGNWSVSASWAVPSHAVSGIYIGRLVRESGQAGASHIVFIVRDDDGHSPILFQTADTTWQAYNAYGGTSLYTGPNGRGAKVSYNRPMTTRQGQCCVGSIQSWLFAAEYPMLRWLERNGYNVSYTTGADTDRRGGELLEHEVFLSVGHDEYWSDDQRTNVEAARNAGVNLAFFSGNEVFWKTRWEASIDGSGTPYRTLVTYKETSAGAKIDPSPEWTGTWRDPRFSPPSDGGRPENALTGTIFMVNGPSRHDAIEVPAEEGGLRFWRNTSIANLPADGVATLPVGVLGFEWDEDRDNGFRPAGLVRLSKTTIPVGTYLLDYGSAYGGGTATHRLTLYRHASGALVFGAGTIQWSWGLDPMHDTAPGLPGPAAADPRMQQATVNLLADMAVQPGTLQSGLISASPSTDTSAPTSSIASPLPGATINGPVTISGTAGDNGGVVGGVEVSLDNGQTWHPAEGREDWKFVWNPNAIGQFTIRSRAVDDSGNIGAASPAVSVTTTAATAAFDDLTPGTLLAGQYPAGQINWHEDEWLVSPPVGSFETVNISFTEALLEASLSFVVPRRLLSIQAFNSGPDASTVMITCASNPPKSVVVPPNEFLTISTGWIGPCDTATIASSNGWNTNFDNLLFDDFGVPPDTTPPVISSVQATVNGTRATITWITDENADTQVEYGPTTNYGSSTPLNSTLVSAHSAALSGLTLNTGYHYRVKSRDSWGNLSVSNDFTFTAACPCSLWDASATPVVPAAADTTSIELGVRFQTDVPGYINGLRFYKGQTNTGTHTAHLWSATGQLIASATFTNESASGWQQVSFPAPVSVSANTTYVASYHAPAGGFSFTRPFFTGPFVASPLSAPVDAGVFKWGASGFPDQTFQSSNYWVDVVFMTSAVDSVPPVVEGHTPADAATGVSPTASVTATFSEPINPGAFSFELRNSSNTLVPATVTYDASARTASLQPTALLELSAGYVASVGNATDLAGNMMVPSSWSFVTASAAESIWGAAATPAIASQSDTAAVELGLKFRSEVGGYIRGIRFYKGPANSGTHTGSLWSVSGDLLARVTFTSETQNGWQEALLPVPIQISADTTYVVSYHAPNGGYSLNQGYFAGGGAANWPLQALGDGMDGANGVFRYGPSAFPGQSYLSSNYWVDVLFATTFTDEVAPSVVATSPASGATKVSPSTNVTARFSEPVQTGSIAFVLRDSQGNSVPAALSYDPSSTTATLNPSVDLPLGGTYTARVSGAKDPAGNVMSEMTWTFSTPACPCTIWDPGVTPAIASQDDPSAIEVGVRFRSQSPGYITGVRFYKGTGNTGTHVGNLWTAAGQLLASATFTGESSNGWQQVTFAGPVAIEPGTTYVASYFAPAGHYSLDVSYFAQDVLSWPLVAPDSGEVGGNGLYRYSSTSSFPSNSHSASNYWVDVVFEPTLQDSVPPSLIAASPTPNASGLPPQTVVSATFNEAVDSQTLSFVLRSNGAIVPATVGYDAAARKATLDPNADLPLGGNFTATIQVKDLAGNQMAPASWSFSTQACPCTLWDSAATPAVASETDTQAVEVGLRFQPAVDGHITALRFYKGPANTGTHVAHLWTAGGQLLANATFSGETASGWQQVQFSTPVPVTAGTTYVASYHAPSGGYARTTDYFLSAYEVFPLKALSPGNGVYGYGPSATFPSSSFAAANYWVDVVFVTAP